MNRTRTGRSSTGSGCSTDDEKCQTASLENTAHCQFIYSSDGQDINQIRLFDGITKLLKQLSNQGVRLAIVSSNSEANVRRVLGPENASFITYYGCGTSLFGKQHKFRKAMEISGVTSRETLCIGDEVRDMESANEASMAFGAVAWGYTRADVLETYPGIKFFTTVDDILQTVIGANLPNTDKTESGENMATES